jgi:hypothetical protein
MAIEGPARIDDEDQPPKGDGRDLSKLRSLLKWDGPPLSLEAMQAAIEAGALARYRRAIGANPPAEDEP